MLFTIGSEFVGKFYEKELLARNNHKEFRTEKRIKRKSENLYVKCKVYKNAFNSWTDKEDIV